MIRQNAGDKRLPLLPNLLWRSGRLIIAIAMGSMLGACRDEKPPPINPEQRWQLYDVAWNRGFSDRLTPLPQDWTRHRQKLIPFQQVTERETIFSTGYEDGFHQHPEEERDVNEMAYDAGYRSGRLDAWSHKPARAATSTLNQEAYAKGYSDGFHGRSHAFHRPY